jgi:hypothetical protein
MNRSEYQKLMKNFTFDTWPLVHITRGEEINPQIAKFQVVSRHNCYLVGIVFSDMRCNIDIQSMKLDGIDLDPLGSTPYAGGIHLNLKPVAFWSKKELVLILTKPDGGAISKKWPHIVALVARDKK